jgi:hypothetical protein
LRAAHRRDPQILIPGPNRRMIASGEQGRDDRAELKPAVAIQPGSPAFRQRLAF